MREILFRGKRLDNGEWVTGKMYRIARDLNPFIMLEDKHGCSYEVDEETVGQYTGLKDKHGKNGKRIFEGDILSFRAGRTHVVRFEDGAFILEDSAIPIPFAIKSEIIGNVHDNPELLKEEAQQ